MSVLLIAVATLWGAGSGLLIPRIAYRLSVEPDEPWRAECPGGHPITGRLDGWLGRARCTVDVTVPTGVGLPAGTDASESDESDETDSFGTAATSACHMAETNVVETAATDAAGMAESSTPGSAGTQALGTDAPGRYVPGAADADGAPDTGGALQQPAVLEQPVVPAQPAPSAAATRPAPSHAPAPSAAAGADACDGRYGPRTTTATLATVLVCAALAAATGPRPEVAVWLLAAPVAVLLAVVDQSVHRLPDLLTLPLAAGTAALLGLAALLPAHAGSWPKSLLGAALLGGVYFVLFLINSKGLGFGDVKLALALGAALGWYGWTVLVIGFLAGLVLAVGYGLTLIVLRRAGRKSAIALGPFMLGGAFLGVVLGAL